MFKQEISSSPLMNEPANTLMAHISGDRFMGDCSFVTTMRAYLYNRMPKGDSINFRISRSDYSVNDVENNTARDMVKNICARNNQIGMQGGFSLHYFTNMTLKANQECMKVITENFENVYEGYKRLPKITEFYRKAFPVVCFINEELKSVALFVEQMDYRRFHYLQCGILPMVPWYFNPADGITELEKKLTESLMVNTPDNYRDCIAKICDTFDFRTEIIKQKLSGFELRYIKDALVSCDQQYKNASDRIAELNRQIGDELRSREELMFRIAGMRAKMESGDEDSEIMEYFLANKNLTLLNSYDSRVEFIVRAKLEYFDPEMAERAIDNKNSLLYTRGRGYNSIETEDLKRLYKMIFLDGVININVCAAFKLSIDGGVSTMGHHSYGDEFSNCMPHPHIDEYNCMGNYVQIINELMARHDYIMALEQCIASTRSLNFADSTVLGHFVNSLMGGGANGRCFELPTGDVVDINGAVKWMKSQKADAK